MKNLAKVFAVFKGKRVLITGDTGFKGSWLALWLAELGADVYGYALPPERNDSHFNLLRLQDRICHHDGDIRDLDKLKVFFYKTKPDIVFHLAAQALVRRSYFNPKETFDTNIGGSTNILECVRLTDSVKSLVYITSDKCYSNKEWIWGYRENDELGGQDPYSASKAAAELVFSAYSSSFYKTRPNFGHSSVRAGNVIGGGDWSDDRIVPDCIRALHNQQQIILRQPHSTRPWQHVLEPLSGYLTLAVALLREPSVFSGPWNFGPGDYSSHTVHNMTEVIVNRWGGGEIDIQTDINAHHEAGLLRLNCDKANQLLGWCARWDFFKTIESTVDWYKRVLAGDSAVEVSSFQIKDYMDAKYD